MTHASVFSGIGGPEVAATMLGWENLFHCEINPFGRKVLQYWYPKAKSYHDITKTDFRKWRGKVDVLTGGFPCQPFSYAGKRRGADDDRYLWPQMFRCIDEIRPTWIVCENVAGITTMVEQGEVAEVAGQASLFGESDDFRRYQLRETFTLERICHDLESHGYAVQAVLVPACAVGAPHRRDRVFIVGHITHPDSIRQPTSESPSGREGEKVDGEGTDESLSGVERLGASHAVTDSACSGEGTPREGGGSQDEGCNQNQQPSERGAASEWNNRFYALLRNATDPDSHRGCEVDEHMESQLADGAKPFSDGGQRNVADTVPRNCYGYEWMQDGEIRERAKHIAEGIGTEDCGEYRVGERWQNFPSVSPVHRGNDGIPFDVDSLTLSFSKWRTEALKAYGNAIVPQVMYEIFRTIEIIEK